MENDKLLKASDVKEYFKRVIFGADQKIDAWVDSIPAVDAVEVVRCRECKHYKPSKFNSGTAHYCAVIDGFPVEEWYCAEGQRREEDHRAVD